MQKIRTAVLISGRGSNMMSLVEASKQDNYPASIELVISNRPEAAGLSKASDANIPTQAINHKDYSSRRKFEAALHKALQSADIELVCCAGFMRVLTPWFVNKWRNKLLNIHPSLLPKYKGLNTHARAIEANDTHHGCSVHWVTSELDGGDVIMQKTIKIDKNDTPERLSAKLLPVELNLYPIALKYVARSMSSEELKRLPKKNMP